MNRKLLVALVLSLCCMGVHAQHLEVVSASGASFKQSTGYISYTIGEIVTSTYIGTGKIINQGFHQTGLPKSWPSSVGTSPAFAMSVFPNPVNDILHIQAEVIKNMRYTLHDVTGVLIDQGLILDERTEIDFSQLSPAIYILRVFDDNQQIRIFQIVKH